MNAITAFEPRNLSESDMAMLSSQAPAALVDYHNMSNKYGQASTLQIVDALAGEGFELASAAQPRETKNARDPRFNVHRVELRHKEATAKNGLKPSIHLLNSHNGRTKLRVFGGLFRFVCSNGLIIGDKSLEVATMHRQFSIERFMGSIFEFQATVMERTAVADEWSEIHLSGAQVFDFARRAVNLRFGENANFEPETVLEAHRTEDKGDSLWTVYNRVQENTVERSIQGQNAIGRKVRSRPLTDVGANQEYNRALWQMAQTFAEAA